MRLLTNRNRHAQFVPRQNIMVIMKYKVIETGLNAIGITLVKVSACIFLLKMVKRGDRTVTWLVYVNLVVLIPFTIATVFIQYLQCIPLEGYWNKSVPAKCLPATTVDSILRANSGIFWIIFLASIMVTNRPLQQSAWQPISLQQRFQYS